MNDMDLSGNIFFGLLARVVLWNILLGLVTTLALWGVVASLRAGETCLIWTRRRNVKRKEHPYLFTLSIILQIMLCLLVLYIALFFRFSCRLAS